MNEPFFLRQSSGLTLEEIVALTGATQAHADADSPPHRQYRPARPGGALAILHFFDSRNFAKARPQRMRAPASRPRRLPKNCRRSVAVLIVREPYRAFVIAARALFPHALRPSSLSDAGDFAHAHVDSSARTEDGVSIEPGAVIGPRAEIGSGTVIGANAVIGADVRIGRDCSIGAGTSLSNALIGDRVIVHPGCKIGQDGFGFVMSGKGPPQGSAGRAA